MIKVGLTGGIGSGKSYVARIFESLDIPVFHSDEIAKLAYTDEDIKNQLIERLGPNSYRSGKLNTEWVARKIFSDKQLLRMINGLIHPWVEQQFVQWTDNLTAVPYVLKEAAILFESGTARFLDYTICVWAPDETRITRVMSRDNQSKQAVIKRMQNQWSQEKIISLSTFQVNNDGTNLVLPQVLKIHQQLMNQ